MSALPFRSTYAEWHDLIFACDLAPISYPEQTAATSAELDALWKSIHGENRYRPRTNITIFGRRVVEVPNWDLLP